MGNQVIEVPRTARVKSRSGIYHVIIRGANRQEIFHDEEDSFKFLEILLKYKKRLGIGVLGWCMMGNHVHLLIKEGNEALGVTMKRIGVSFVSYYNWKYFTTGHLFQDRFKSENVETDAYLLTVIRYIHQNPVKVGIVKLPPEWKWSSCREYYGMGCSPAGLLDASFILRLYSDNMEVAKDRFKEFNERKNEDECLDDSPKIIKLSDQEAREKIKAVLGEVDLAHVKSLTKRKREDVLRRVKGLEGVSQRQAARILGVSPTLIFKA